MKKHFITLIFICVTFITIAQNQPWAVVSSNITFKIKNAGFTVNGKFSGLKATIQFDATKNSDNKIEASIDANTINTDNSMRDGHLKKEEYFAVDKFPKIDMSTTSITKEADGKFKGLFTLTIKNIHKTIPVVFSFAESTEKATFQCSFTINRLDYKVGSSSFLLSDDVTVNVDVTCVKK